MKSLVTGGAGFIGSHIVDALINKGIDVVCIDDLSNGKIENVNKKAKFIKLNILDTPKLINIFKSEKFDNIFHEAAIVSIRHSINNFFKDCQTNVMGTLSIIEACKYFPPKRFIYASSMGVYADSNSKKPLQENDNTVPISPYGISKLASEQYIKLICPAIGFDFVILRYFNTYGPRQQFSPYVGVINIFARLIKAGKSPQIYGNGSQSRDFIAVKDVVFANLKALSTKNINTIYNVGTGNATTINNLFQLISQAYSKKIKPSYLKKDKTELKYAVADTKKALTKLKFKSRIKLDIKQIRSLY